MNAAAKHHRARGVASGHQEEPAERARRIADLKRRVASGTYLIQRYEIIEGLLDSLATATD